MVVVQRLSFCWACVIASVSLTSSGLMHREVTGAFSVPAFPCTSTVVLISHFPGWTLTPAARAVEAVVRKAVKQSSATIVRVGRVGRAVWLAVMVVSRQALARGAIGRGGTDRGQPRSSARTGLSAVALGHLQPHHTTSAVAGGAGGRDQRLPTAPAARWEATWSSSRRCSSRAAAW